MPEETKRSRKSIEEQDNVYIVGKKKIKNVKEKKVREEKEPKVKAVKTRTTKTKEPKIKEIEEPVVKVKKEKITKKEKNLEKEEVKEKKVRTRTKTKENKETIIKEEIEKEETSLIEKIDPKDLVIDEEKLELIEEERIKQKNIPKDELNTINKEIFKNIILAIGIVLYFIFLIFGYINIKGSTYTVDLQVFSMSAIIVTVVIFEKAYKKDSNKLTLFGIELLMLSIVTLLTMYVYSYLNAKYIYIINAVSMIFGTYYVGKCIVIYEKMKKSFLNKKSDVRNIIKK